MIQSHEDKVEYIIETLLDAKWILMTPFNSNLVSSSMYGHLVLYPHPKNERPPTACGIYVDPSMFTKAVSNEAFPVTIDYENLCPECLIRGKDNPQRYGWDITLSVAHEKRGLRKYTFKYIGG